MNNSLLPVNAIFFLVKVFFMFKYFNSSKILINKHQEYLKKYVITLTVNGQVQKSINIIKQNGGQNNTRFFEAKLLLLIDNFKKKEFDQNIQLLNL